MNRAEHPGLVLAAAEKELHELWTALPAPGDTPKTRACTMNLVVAGAPDVAAAWLPIVDDVLQSVPARAILVALDPDADDDIEASVSAVCTRGSDGPSVCSERITLAMRGSVCGRLPSCVEALCAADVPLTLVWLGHVRADDPAFAPLARTADRIVLEASHGSLSSLAHVMQWAQSRPLGERPGVAELAWTRLAPWQELCARMFDDPRVRSLAGGVTRVGLVQASPAGATLGPEGALLLAWLATRLKWQASSLASKLRLLRPDGVNVRVDLRAKAVPSANHGDLLAVEIAASDVSTTMRGEVTRGHQAGDDAGTWRVELTTGGETQRIEQRVRMEGSEPARALEDTLRRPVHDEALGEAVAWADELRSEDLVCH